MPVIVAFGQIVEFGRHALEQEVDVVLEIVMFFFGARVEKAENLQIDFCKDATEVEFHRIISDLLVVFDGRFASEGRGIILV